MADFDDFDVEIQDEKDSGPEQFNDTVATAGSPNTHTPTSTKQIQLAYLKNPNKGPNANSAQDVILFNIDGGTEFSALARGEYVYIAGVFDDLKIDANNNGVNYEVILWS